MRNITQLTAVCSLVMFKSNICVAQATIPIPLSLNQAISRAIRLNPLAKQYKYELKGAQAVLVGAGVPPNPTLSLAQHVGSNTGGLDEDFLVTQTYPLGDRLRQQTFAAKDGITSAQNLLQTNQVDLTTSASTDYYLALQATAQLNLAQYVLDYSEKFAKATLIEFQAGTAPKSNVLRSNIAVAQATQAVNLAEAAQKNALSTLCSLIGLPSDTPLKLTDSLQQENYSTSLTKLQNFALKHRTDLQSAKDVKLTDLANLHLVRTQNDPDLFLEIRHTPLFNYPAGNSIRLGILFPIVDYGSQKSSVEAAQAVVDQQQSQITLLSERISLEVTTAYNNLLAARKSVDAYQNGELTQTKNLLQMVQLGYSRGANTYLELLDAQQAYQTEQTNYINALANYDIDLALLKKAEGGEFPN